MAAQAEIVNAGTGEAHEPTELLSNLREIEEQIQRYDDEIARLKDLLKQAREDRENAVANLRGAVRDGAVLPLLERESEEAE